MKLKCVESKVICSHDNWHTGNIVWHTHIIQHGYDALTQYSIGIMVWHTLSAFINVRALSNQH